uniref:GIY-YIG nuclease family protein n=1 Tax=Pseudomonas aeruginosa TaxID=287 RepID=UPI00104CF7EE
FIYCLGNAAMPGIYKIGMTERAPLQRCDELSSSTSSPLPFKLLCFGQVEDPKDVEAEIHDGLADRRVNHSREFFAGPFKSIASIIQGYSSGFALTSDGYEEEEKERLHNAFLCAEAAERVEALNEAAKFSGIYMCTRRTDRSGIAAELIPIAGCTGQSSA